jgi:D-3-phosphoglycerate dehydrogenase
MRLGEAADRRLVMVTTVPGPRQFDRVGTTGLLLDVSFSSLAIPDRPDRHFGMARILVTEAIADSGLERLRRAGHQVDVREGLSPSDLLQAIRGAHALIIRSATQVTAEVLAAGSELIVVGRAGIGLDNVDVAAATERGVMVVNAPQSNVISAAEHTMALLLAQARNVPQAHAALVAGRWERSKWEGVELADKTLGIVGLGRIGKLVADRAKAFQMRLVAYDPFVSSERAKQMGVELLPLDQLVAEADFLTIHLPKTKDTTGLINRDLLMKAKPSLRVINVARGGIVVESDLAECIRDGVIAGAALDVFDSEPTIESPLFQLPEVVVTPHLGASTREAQDKAGEAIADMVQLALAGEFVPWAVNVAAAEAHENLRPFLPLAERLGRLYGSLHRSSPDSFELCCQGDIARYDTRIIGLAVLKGFFSLISEDPVSYVNAPQLAKSAGVSMREVNRTDTDEYVNLITLRCENHHSISGTLAGRRGEQRIVEIDGHSFDVPPADHMLVVTNDDRPGVIGTVGTILGNAAVNIADMDVGRVADEGRAVMLIATVGEVPGDVVESLRSAPGILSVAELQG